MAKTIANTYKTMSTDMGKYTELMGEAAAIRNAVMMPVEAGGLSNAETDGGAPWCAQNTRQI